MIHITDAPSAAEAHYTLACALLNAPDRELFIGERRVVALAHDSFEFTVEWGKLIFAWWGDGVSQSWRVQAYEIDGADLLLHATRGAGRESAVLTLRDVDRWRQRTLAEELSPRERRTHYAQSLAQWIATRVSAAKIARATTGADRTRAVVGRYARLTLQLGGETVLAIGVSRHETQADIDGVVAAGLIWLASFNAEREEKQKARRFWFCLPDGCERTALERLTFIDVARYGARVECFAVDEMHGALTSVLPVTQYELLNAHPHEVRWPSLPIADNPWRERILALAPGALEIRALAYDDAASGESYAINGLEFARRTSEGPLSFGVAGVTGSINLTESSWERLAALVSQIIKYRSPDGPDRRHEFYRLRAEGWLESLLRRNIRALDVGLDERFVYSQLPAWRGEERSVIDLLTVNFEGRLVVIEIKAAEDPHLPLQGLDYWLRVEQARLRGEFVRRRLFAGIRLAEQPPLLYLVAPRLRFHRTFACVAAGLATEIEAFQLGINTDWRGGVRVNTRERINPT